MKTTGNRKVNHGGFIRLLGWGLSLKCPCEEPLFSERNGYTKPIVRCFGWRLFVLERIGAEGNMIQFFKNIWNAQQNALEVDRLFIKCSGLVNIVARLTDEKATVTFERNQYSALTATLANEYLQTFGDLKDYAIPDSIREAHMLRGVATNWTYADDLRYGKPMWERLQRMEEKRKQQDDTLRQVMANQALPSSWGQSLQSNQQADNAS